MTTTQRMMRSSPRRLFALAWAGFVVCGWSGAAQTMQSRSAVAAPSAEVAQALGAGGNAMRGGDFAGAVAQFKIVTGLQPQFAEGHLNLGLALEQEGDAAAAVAELETARRLKPTLRGANLFLGIAEYKLNAMDKAEAALQREVKLNPVDAKAWMWLGVAQTAAGRSEEAVAALDKAAALDPKDPDILYHRGRAHLLVSKASYERMFALEPDSYRVHEVLAQAAVESQQTAEAITEYKAAIERAPKHTGLHEELGDLYWASGQTADADAAYVQELALDPYSVTSEYKLGCLRETVGDAAGAEPLLRKAIAADPSLENAYYYLGRAEVDLGEDAAGIADLRHASAAKDDVKLPTLAYYQLARAYRRLHRTQEADAALAQYRALRAETDKLEAARLAARTDRHSLPKQEALPTDADAQP